jgi:hypothetical protein
MGPMSAIYIAGEASTLYPTSISLNPSPTKNVIDLLGYREFMLALILRPLRRQDNQPSIPIYL